MRIWEPLDTFKELRRGSAGEDEEVGSLTFILVPNSDRRSAVAEARQDQFAPKILEGTKR
jgi:hypothetical protein